MILHTYRVRRKKRVFIKAQLSYVLPIYLWSMRLSVQSALCDDDD